MSNKLINFARPYSQYKLQKSAIKKAIFRVIKSGDYILGENVEQFEKEFSDYIGMKFCIGVNSGTDALILALRAIGISHDDEVIVPSHTAVATVAAICSVGAKPIFVDIDTETFTLSASKIEKLISKSTRAIIAVHLYGQACDMDSLNKICLKFNVHLIEDCSQSHGATWKSRKTGTFGIISCFSFYPTKNLGAIGDAGALLTNNEFLATRIFALRQYGWDKDKNSQFIAPLSRMDELQASVLRIKLKSLDKNNTIRRKIAHRYLSEISNPKVILPRSPSSNFHVYHLFVIRVPQREFFRQQLIDSGIETGIHYPLPVHKQQAYKVFNTPSSNPLINTERISSEIISLPIYPGLKNSEVTRIINTVNSIRLENN
jgi:dTDP-4-amino-4,6-dideoxygalactose transaminase